MRGLAETRTAGKRERAATRGAGARRGRTRRGFEKLVALSPLPCSPSRHQIGHKLGAENKSELLTCVALSWHPQAPLLVLFGRLPPPSLPFQTAAPFTAAR